MPAVSSRAWKKAPTVAVWLILLSLAAANALLIRQNYQLRAALSRYEPDTLRAGERLPSFSAKDIRGEPLEIQYAAAGPKRVLLYFTPSCPYCRGQFAYWREILQRVGGNHFEVIGLVAESEDKGRVEEYLRSVGCGTDSATPLRIALVPELVRRRYKLTATPITLVVGNDGTVEQAWSGRWDASALSSASAVFGINFARH